MRLALALLLIAPSSFASDFLSSDARQELSSILSRAQAVTHFFQPKDGKPPIEQYPVRGFDVSHYQEAVDWTRVQADGWSFVFIKATEGDHYVDDHFAGNWSGSSRAGLAKGAYHFWNFCARGATQADNFAAVVPVDAQAMPATIDIEPSASCRKLPPKAAFRKDLADFIAAIEARYGKTPILYVDGDIYRRYFAGDRLPYPIWFAYPRDPAPKLPDGKNWTFWQYAFHGSVRGIGGEVDLDVFNGTKAQFASWLQRGGDSIGTLALPR